MERQTTPSDLIAEVDFTLDDLCRDCPMRSSANFDPAYGVRVASNENTTVLHITNFEVEYDNRRSLLGRWLTTKHVVLSEGHTMAPLAEQAFEDCGGPVALQRKVIPNKIVCGALNRLLGAQIPTKKNLKIKDI